MLASEKGSRNEVVKETAHQSSGHGYKLLNEASFEVSNAE